MVNQKGNSLFLGITIGLLIAGVCFVGYYFLVPENSNLPASNSSQVPQSKHTNSSVPTLDPSKQPAFGSDDLKFDINQIKVGESFYGEMIVKSIEPFSVGYSELSKDNFRITFSGQATLSGSYYIRDGTEMGIGGKYVTFTPDESSFSRLPRERYAGEFGYAKSFTLNNYEKAVELLMPNGKKGTATIVIDNYTLVGYPSEISNSADLIEVK